MPSILTTVVLLSAASLALASPDSPRCEPCVPISPFIPFCWPLDEPARNVAPSSLRVPKAALLLFIVLAITALSSAVVTADSSNNIPAIIAAQADNLTPAEDLVSGADHRPRCHPNCEPSPKSRSTTQRRQILPFLPPIWSPPPPTLSPPYTSGASTNRKIPATIMLLLATLTTPVLGSMLVAGPHVTETKTLPAITVTVEPPAQTVTETKTASTLTVIARTITKTEPGSTAFVTERVRRSTKTITKTKRTTITQKTPSEIVTVTHSQPALTVTLIRECSQSSGPLHELTVPERPFYNHTALPIPTLQLSPAPGPTRDTRRGLGNDIVKLDKLDKLKEFHELLGDLTGLSAALLRDASEQLSTIIKKGVEKHPDAMFEAFGEAAKGWVGEAEGIAGGVLEGLPDLLLGPQKMEL